MKKKEPKIKTDKSNETDVIISPMTTNFEKLIGKKICIVGRISNVIWQHLIMQPPETHPCIQYFDLEDSYQLVIYTKEEIESSKKIELIGKVMKVYGRSKRPDTKGGPDYSEYQLLVEKFREIE